MVVEQLFSRTHNHVDCTFLAQGVACQIAFSLSVGDSVSLKTESVGFVVNYHRGHFVVDRGIITGVVFIARVVV